MKRSSHCLCTIVITNVFGMRKTNKMLKKIFFCFCVCGELATTPACSVSSVPHNKVTQCMWNLQVYGLQTASASCIIINE